MGFGTCPCRRAAHRLVKMPPEKSPFGKSLKMPADPRRAQTVRVGGVGVKGECLDGRLMLASVTDTAG